MDMPLFPITFCEMYLRRFGWRHILALFPESENIKGAIGSANVFSTLI
jgi:hypothetical protein